MLYPYTGNNALFVMLLVTLILLAAASFYLLVRTDKKTKGATGDELTKLTSLKNVFAALVGLMIIASFVVGFGMDSWSKKIYTNSIVQSIESTGAVIVEGFENPSLVITPNNHAKFVIETKNSGLNRCRATAEGVESSIKFMCQDSEKNFTVRLEDAMK